MAVIGISRALYTGNIAHIGVERGSAFGVAIPEAMWL